jgi:hypothetical protein
MGRRKLLIIAMIILAAGLCAASVFIVLNAGSWNGNGNGTDCGSNSYYDCPDGCVVCPPCAECSSLRCASEEFCESIGFNRTWYDDIKSRLNGSA